MIFKSVTLKPTLPKVRLDLVKNQVALLMPIGDVHYGTKGFPVERFVEHLQWGMDRGAWFIGMGEYLDFTSASQRQLLAPLRDSTKLDLDDMVKTQIDEFAELIGFTQGRWIGIIEGDHRYDFATGTSGDQYLASKLDADFGGTSMLIRLCPGKGYEAYPEADTIVYVHHGVGSSRMQGGQLHRVEDLLKWVNADIYLMGHTHAKIEAAIDQQCISVDGVHYHRTKAIARTGGWFRAYLSSEPLANDSPVLLSRGSYVEQKALTPSSLGGLCIGIGVEQVEGSSSYRPAIHVSI